jgi:hypothetical protein
MTPDEAFEKHFGRYAEDDRDRHIHQVGWGARQAEVDGLKELSYGFQNGRNYLLGELGMVLKERDQLRAELAAAKARLERWNPELQQAKADLARTREALEKISKLGGHDALTAQIARAALKPREGT